MRNVILINRGQVFDTEIKPRLDQYKNDNVVLVIDNKLTRKIVSYITKDYEQKINIITIHEYLNKGVVDNMKFDVIIGNPPYQLQVGPNKTQAIWHKVVDKCLDLLSPGGSMTMIHPSGWRNPSGIFKSLQERLKTKKIEYIQMNSIEEGLKTFGAQIRFDVYHLINEKPTQDHLTKLIGQDGTIKNVNISNMDFIPNGNFDLVDKIIAKPNEEKVEVLYSRSAYGTDKKNMSSEKVGEFKYPCVYSINVDEIPSYFYSSIKGEHFGTKKFIIPNGDARSIGFIKDINGEYGLTQFSCAIVEENKEIQETYHKLFRSKEFISFYNTNLCIGKTQYNWKVLSLFKKDFWKEFV